MDQIQGSSSEDIRRPPVPSGHGLTTREREETDFAADIKGWGSDLDPRVRPGVPYDKEPMLGAETLYPPIPQQVPKIRIHKSTEHGRLTPVFGTSCPPMGLSGRLPDFGYRFSEGRLARWLTLMLADRVNMVEGIVDDLSHGQIPNIPKEMGLASEWRYNKRKVIGKSALLVGGATLFWMMWRRQSRQR